MSSERRPSSAHAPANSGMPLSWMLIPLIAIIVGALWWFLSSESPETQLPPPVTQSLIKPTEPGAGESFAPIERALETPESPEAATADSTPAPAAVPPRPKIELPTLSNSDAPVKKLASEVSPEGTLLAFLVPESILRKVVNMIIALDEHTVVKEHRPLASPEPGMRMQAISEEVDPSMGPRYRIDPRNFERYTAHVELLAKLDKVRLAQLYHDLYPLLDQAYKEYGVDRGSFYEVTQRALDHVLEVPIREESPALIQPKVFYQYQDPVVEKRTSIDKLLMRMGPDNTLRVQAQLRELKMELQRQKP